MPEDWFAYVPAVPLVMGTVMVQLPAPEVGTVRFSEVAPETRTGVLVTPEQVPPIDGGEVTAKTVSVSVRLQALSEPVLGLLMVKVKSEVLKVSSELGLKASARLALSTPVKMAVLLTGPWAVAPTVAAPLVLE